MMMAKAFSSSTLLLQTINDESSLISFTTVVILLLLSELSVGFCFSGLRIIGNVMIYLIGLVTIACDLLLM